MQIVKFKNGYESFMDDELAEKYRKKGKVEIISDDKPKETKVKKETKK